MQGKEAIDICRRFFPHGRKSRFFVKPGEFPGHVPMLDQLAGMGIIVKRESFSTGRVVYSGTDRSIELATGTLRSAHPMTQGIAADGTLAARARAMYELRRQASAEMPAWDDLDPNDDYQLGLRDACLFFALEGAEAGTAP